MTLQKIKERIKYINSIRGDDEAAHGEEDALMQDFINWVSKQPGPMQEMAKEVLKTNEIEFSRWCA